MPTKIYAQVKISNGAVRTIQEAVEIISTADGRIYSRETFEAAVDLMGREAFIQKKIEKNRDLLSK